MVHSLYIYFPIILTLKRPATNLLVGISSHLCSRTGLSNQQSLAIKTNYHYVIGKEVST